MPEATSTDSELIAAWRRGDQAAAAELVRRHAQAVARFLSAAGAGPEVEDLVQETFYRAFRKIDGFRGGASFRTWVMTIGANLLKDHRRRAGRRPTVPLDGQEAPAPGDPASETESRELVRRLEAELTRLPRMQREVFLLRAQQGLEYEEIAAALDTTVAAARVHYHHAVQRLKRVLELER